MAYDQLEPIGNDLVLATIARIGAYLLARWRNEGDEVIQPNDLIPLWKPEADQATQAAAEQQTPNQQAAMFKMYAAQQGWRVK